MFIDKFTHKPDPSVFSNFVLLVVWHYTQRCVYTLELFIPVYTKKVLSLKPYLYSHCVLKELLTPHLLTQEHYPLNSISQT